MSNKLTINKVDRKTTPKSLLKDGMRCTDREGDVWWVCGDIMVYPRTRAVVELERWDDILSHQYHKTSDILLITDRDGTVVWKRSEPLRLTLAEIAEHYGVESVEVVDE